VGGRGGMISDSRSLLSAGECLVVATGASHVCRQDELTDAIGLSGAAVVEIYYVAHLACFFMQCDLVFQASARLARD
jgi:hypothetical protein